MDRVRPVDARLFRFTHVPSRFARKTIKSISFPSDQITIRLPPRRRFLLQLCRHIILRTIALVFLACSATFASPAQPAWANVDACQEAASDLDMAERSSHERTAYTERSSELGDSIANTQDEVTKHFLQVATDEIRTRSNSCGPLAMRWRTLTWTLNKIDISDLRFAVLEGKVDLRSWQELGYDRKYPAQFGQAREAFHLVEMDAGNSGQYPGAPHVGALGKLAENKRLNRCAGPDSDARTISSVEAEYPVEARQIGAVGEIRVLVTIADTGKVVHVAVGKSSGNALLDAAGLKAATESTFYPEIKSCRAISGTYFWSYDWTGT